jgi:TPP-dependent pyruvate/acetoin dehydrogenase alpha subunit
VVLHTTPCKLPISVIIGGNVLPAVGMAMSEPQDALSTAELLQDYLASAARGRA